MLRRAELEPLLHKTAIKLAIGATEAVAQENQRKTAARDLRVAIFYASPRRAARGGYARQVLQFQELARHNGSIPELFWSSVQPVNLSIKNAPDVIVASLRELARPDARAMIARLSSIS